MPFNATKQSPPESSWLPRGLSTAKAPGATRKALTSGELFYPGPRPVKMLEAGQWDFPGAEPVAMKASNVEPRPASVYGVTKLAQEQLLRLWGDAFGCEIGILRLQNVYGPGQTPSNPYTGIMSLFLSRGTHWSRNFRLRGRVIRRDFVIIDDVAAAVIAVVEADTCPPDPIDIGSGDYLTILEAAQIIADIYHAPAPHYRAMAPRRRSPCVG